MNKAELFMDELKKLSSELSDLTKRFNDLMSQANGSADKKSVEVKQTKSKVSVIDYKKIADDLSDLLQVKDLFQVEGEDTFFFRFADRKITVGQEINYHGDRSKCILVSGTKVHKVFSSAEQAAEYLRLVSQ